MTVTVFGIPNCDTVKKGRQWLLDHGIAHVFHDFKKLGVPEALDDWCAALGTDVLVNKKGSTWRTLPEHLQAQACDPMGAKDVMREHPSLIKRPVVAWSQGGSTRWSVGFDARQWADLAHGCDAA